MHDIIKKGAWKKVHIKDKTKDKNGLPTFKAMERRLHKVMRNV